MILDVKDKIVKIRKELKLSQKELAGNVYSQSYVAAIEKGKRNISDEALYYFASRFTEEYKNQGVDKEITYEWLSRSFGKQLEEYYEKTCKDILECRDKDNLYRYYDELKKVEEHLKVEERVKIYHYLGYMLIMVEDYEKSQEVYKKALYEAILLEDYDYLGKIMANIYHNLKVMKKNEGIIEYQSLLDKYERYLEDRALNSIYSHLLFLYEFKNDSENAIKCIEKLERICNSEKKIGYLLSKFTHYVDMNKISEAKKLYPKFLLCLREAEENMYHFYRLESLNFYEKVATVEEVLEVIEDAVIANDKKKLTMETSYRVGKALINYNKIEKGKELLVELLTDRMNITVEEYATQVGGIKSLMPYMERSEVHLVIELWEKTKNLLEGYRDYSYIPPFIEYFNKFYFTKELEEVTKDLKTIFDVTRK